MSVLTTSTHLLTLPNTFCNIIGSILIVALVYISLETKCFTLIFNKK